MGLAGGGLSEPPVVETITTVPTPTAAAPSTMIPAVLPRNAPPPAAAAPAGRSGRARRGPRDHRRDAEEPRGQRRPAVHREHLHRIRRPERRDRLAAAVFPLLDHDRPLFRRLALRVVARHAFDVDRDRPGVGPRLRQHAHVAPRLGRHLDVEEGVAQCRLEVDAAHLHLIVRCDPRVDLRVRAGHDAPDGGGGHRQRRRGRAGPAVPRAQTAAPRVESRAHGRRGA